ncbi:MAG: hypothetical protein QOD06_371, partial [Candidatus Binatota bacterium]|nr:hypothetical protein [Candidatus Binatota bacterium]
MVLAFSATLFFVALGGMPLLDPDEGRHAEIARRMLAGGEWLVPEFKGAAYLEKPPGFYWTVALAYRLFGVGAWAARLPSAAAAVAGVLAVFLAGRRLYGTRAGTVGALVLATSCLYLMTGRLVLVDMAFSVPLAGAILYLACWAERRERPFPAPAYVLAGAATLFKGPIALVLFACTLAVHRLLSRDQRLVPDLRIGRGLLVAALVAAPPYAAAAFLHPEWLTGFLWKT